MLGIIIAIIVLLVCACGKLAESTGAKEYSTEAESDNELTAQYLGIKNSLSLSRDDVLEEGAQVYTFNVNGTERILAVDGSDNYAIQNILVPGHNYTITIKDNTVISAKNANGDNAFATSYKPLLSGNPGKRTILNLLKTAFEPMGTTLYIYGGGWDFQDEGSGNQTRIIGVSDAWVNFFNNNNASYEFHDTCGNGINYYPENGWNTYYYNGLDCSAYIGWTLYNTMYSQSMTQEGFVCASTKMAKTLAKEYGFGTWEHVAVNNPSEKDFQKVVKTLKPGDIVSMNGHVYMVVGVCTDNSAVIINSTATLSSTGAEAGGVQINAISVKGTGDTGCEAYNLACQYTAKYPKWAERYPVTMKDPATYLAFPEKNAATGILHWNVDENGLNDPEGIRNMNAEQVLQEIFR